MPTRWAIQNGDNNALSTWNDSGTLGLPTSADDVFTNGFTVNMVANATYISMNNTARARDIATPAMTANNAPSPFVAAASNIAGGSNDAFRAFDRNTGTNWATASGTTTGWLSMDFGNSIIIDAYTITGTGTQTFNPRNWTFEGSTNNTTWTTLHTVTLPSAIAASSSYSSGSISNPTAYRYYRVNITLNGTGAQVGIAELELYQPGTAALAAGGSFNFNTAGVTVSATSISQGATNMMTVTHVSGDVTINVSSNITVPGGLTTVSYTGSGNLILTCPNMIGIANAASNTAIINKTSAGQVTINGNLIQPFLSNTTAAQYLFISNNGNTVINGNVLGNSSPTTSGNPVYVVNQTAGNLTINGNVIPVGRTTLSTSFASIFFSGTTLTLNGNTQGGDGLAIISSGTVNVTGNLVGGNSVYASSNITINITGDVYAGTLFSAINCSAFTSSVVNLTGNMYNTLGRMAIWCPNVFISNTATTLWRMDTGGGNYKFLYSADTTPNLPPITDVRFGTTFGPALSLTGTMVVLANSDVRKDVPNDNSVGTAELTSADIISGINASSDPLAVRLKNALTDVTAGNIISQYKDS